MQQGSSKDACSVEESLGAAMRTVEQVPHSQRLRLDRVGQTSYRLTDILTLERKVFVGVWELVYLDDAGDQAALVGVDEAGHEQVVLAADIFKKDVFVDSKGERFIVVRGAEQAQPTSLDVSLARYRDGNLSLRLGCGAASASIECFVMMLPRACRQ